MSIRSRLAMLVLALALPAGLLAIAVAYNAYRDQRTAAERSLQETTRALALAVDREIAKVEASARILAGSTSLVRDDLAAFYGEALAITDEHQWVALYDRSHVVIHTRRPLGAELPAFDPHESIVTEVFDRGRATLTPLYRSRVVGEWTMSFATPVRVRGTTRYGVSVSFDPARLTRVFEEQKLEPRWIAAILDRDGTFIARTREPARWIGQRAAPLIRQGALGAMPSPIESVTVEGTPVLSAVARSPTYGLMFVIGVPLDDVHAIGRAALVNAALGAGLLLVAALAFALLMANRIVRPIQSLARAAATLGEGGPVSRPTPGVAEVDAVGAALLLASDALRDRDRLREQDANALRELNATLESRVAQRTEELSAANRRLMLEMAERERAEATLRHVQKLEAVGQLTGGVAHDFNNLLQAVAGYLHVLHRRIDDPQLRSYVASAQEALRRGSRLTGQLLAFARRQRLHPTPTDVNALIQGMADMLARTLGGTIAVRTQLAPDAWPAVADAAQLELCLLNLAINARDAMPDGGTLTLATGNATLAPEDADRGDLPPGEYLLISAGDTGVGMEEAVARRAFEPFFTTKPVGHGTGLGLSTVYGTVRQLGGDVRLRTAPGVGTRVTIYLPRAGSPAAVAATERAAAAGSGTALRARILLVDDDDEVRKVLAEVLREVGHTVTESPDAAAALTALEAAPHDVLISDYAMQGTKGDELCCRALERHPELEIVLLTGYADAPVLAIEPDMVVRKPVTGLELQEVVASRLARARARLVEPEPVG